MLLHKEQNKPKDKTILDTTTQRHKLNKQKNQKQNIPKQTKTTTNNKTKTSLNTPTQLYILKQQQQYQQNILNQPKNNNQPKTQPNPYKIKITNQLNVIKPNLHTQRYTTINIKFQHMHLKKTKENMLKLTILAKHTNKHTNLNNITPQSKSTPKCRSKTT